MSAAEKSSVISAPPHPATIIFLWGCLTVAMQSLQATGLLLAGVPLLLLGFALSSARLATLLRRTRWIMLSLLLIYGYATPGVALWIPLAEFSPTVEGLTDGLLQLCRLVFALAGLAILLGLLSQQQLIGGLYTLAYPLRYVGLSRARLAVRLALTLHYAEATLRETTCARCLRVEDMLLPPAGGQESVELHILPLTARDGLLLVMGLALLVWVRL
jgi:energy-coupling factor transport system permease protein